MSINTGAANARRGTTSARTRGRHLYATAQTVLAPKCLLPIEIALVCGRRGDASYSSYHRRPVRICNEERVMLILTRRLTEALCLGPDITVTVLSIKSNKVRIGVDAPRSVSVDRQEVRQRKRRSTVANPSRTVDPAGRAEPTDRMLELAD